MEKQVLNRGYVTYALTDGAAKIYGMKKDHYISDWSREPKNLYWSEVYCEAGYMAKVVRKGKLIVNASNEELSELHEQSKVNLN